MDFVIEIILQLYSRSAQQVFIVSTTTTRTYERGKGRVI